jgi:hypothetical protein
MLRRRTAACTGRLGHPTRRSGSCRPAPWCAAARYAPRAGSAAFGRCSASIPGTAPHARCRPIASRAPARATPTALLESSVRGSTIPLGLPRPAAAARSDGALRCATIAASADGARCVAVTAARTQTPVRHPARVFACPGGSLAARRPSRWASTTATRPRRFVRMVGRATSTRATACPIARSSRAASIPSAPRARTAAASSAPACRVLASTVASFRRPEPHCRVAPTPTARSSSPQGTAPNRRTTAMARAVERRAVADRASRAATGSSSRSAAAMDGATPAPVRPTRQGSA